MPAMLSLQSSHRAASSCLHLSGSWAPDGSVREGVVLMWKPASFNPDINEVGWEALFPPPVFCAIWAGSDVSLMPTTSHYTVTKQMFASRSEGWRMSQYGLINSQRPPGWEGEGKLISPSQSSSSATPDRASVGECHCHPFLFPQ